MSFLRYHSRDEIDQTYARLSKTFHSGSTLPLAYRRRQLLQLARCMQDNAIAFEDAVLEDIGKHRLESNRGEVAAVIAAALFAAEHLEEWAKEDKPTVSVPVRDQWDTTVYKVPKGLVLVIGPWNYPFILTLGPLVGAIVAGCTCVVKASELAPRSAQVLSELLPNYIDSDAYAFINGAVMETTHLLDLKWDHILFTGSLKTGRIVSVAAAKYVTPVTLELGGKSPVIIDPDFEDIELVARRVLYGKQQNSGQLCVSPDYVLVPRAKQDQFIAALLKTYKEFWPNGPFHESIGWGSIVNPAHHARLRGILERTKGTILVGGQFDGQKRIAPTIVKDVQTDDSLMEDEIFGPILPLITVDDLDDAIRVVRTQPVPLAVYAFTTKETVKDRLIHETRSGALVLNETFTQVAVLEMPFGGQGESGHGAWYGESAFDTFTHRRGYINVPPAMEPSLASRYPPYTPEKYQGAARSSMVKIPDA